MGKVVYSTYKVHPSELKKKRKRFNGNKTPNKSVINYLKKKGEESVLSTLGQNPNHKPFS
jgi:hypothetical protein